VALAEPPAAFVSFQRHYAGFPPCKNATSAGVSELAAVQFSGELTQMLQFMLFLQHLQQKVRFCPLATVI